MQAAWLAGQGAMPLAGAGQSPAAQPEALWVKGSRLRALEFTSALSPFGCTGSVAVSGVGPRWRNRDALSKNVRAMTYEQRRFAWFVTTDIELPRVAKEKGSMTLAADDRLRAEALAVVARRECLGDPLWPSKAPDRTESVKAHGHVVRLIFADR